MGSILYRRPTVEAITGLSRSGIYELMAKGAFPRPVSLGARAVAWRSDEVENWVRNLPRASERRSGAGGRSCMSMTDREEERTAA